MIPQNFNRIKLLLLGLCIFISSNLFGQEYVQFHPPTGFPTNSVYQICFSEFGDAKWFSTVGNGLIKWTEDNELINYNTENSVLAADSLFATFHDSQDNLWLATFGSGLAKIDADGYWHYFTRENSLLPSDFVTNIVEDSQGNIWISTIEFMSNLLDGVDNGGIIKIEPDGEWTHYSKSNSPLTTNNTFSLLLDESDNLWIGTINAATPDTLLDDGGGLCKLSAAGEWTIYNTENSGIKSNNIMSLVMDEMGSVYAGSMDGYVSRLHQDGTWDGFLINNAGPPGPTGQPPVIRGSILNMNLHKNDLYIGFGPSDLLCFPQIGPANNALKGMIVLVDIANDPEINHWTLSNYHTDSTLLDYSNLIEGIIFPATSMPFKEYDIPAIKVDESDNIWIGTIGGGMYVFNREELINAPSEVELISTPLTEIASEEVLGINDLKPQITLSVAPNPTSQNVLISWKLSELEESVFVKLSNLKGQIVFTNHFDASTNQTSIDMSNWSTGHYLLEVYSANQLLASEKIVKGF